MNAVVDDAPGPRRLPMAGGPRPPQDRRTRSDWHRLANGVVLAYLAATVAALPLHAAGITPRWIVIHLLLLGAVTNAIVTWTAHFTSAMLHAPDRHPHRAGHRLAALNVGVLGVLTGVATGTTALTLIGATALTAAVVAHLAALAGMARRGLGGPFKPLVRFYWAAGIALLGGMAAGVLMATGADGALHERFHAAHLQLNLLGWVGLTVLGTLFLLWPTVLRTRMADGAMTAARRALPACAGGLALAAGGLLADSRPAAAAGLALYLAGVLLSLVPAVRACRTRIPRSPAAMMLAASTLWLVAALVAQIAAVATAPDIGTVAERISAMLPWFLAGFVAQVLIGSLTYLLPMVLGGGPAGGKAAAVLIDRLGYTRLLVGNAGVALVALPLPTAVQRLGWALVIASAAGFVALALTTAATTRSVRIMSTAPPTEPAAAPPAHDDRRPVVIGVGFALALLLIAVLVINLGDRPDGDDGEVVLTGGGTQTVEVSLLDTTVRPGSIAVEPGTHLILDVVNDAAMRHDLAFPDGPATAMLAPGERESLDLGVVTGPIEGWCTVVGHRAAGMTLTIDVADGTAHAHGGHDEQGSTSSGEAAVPAAIDPAAEPGPGFAPYDAALPPAADGDVHEVTMRVTDELIEVAPGVEQLMWTFNGTVPGPTLRGKVGDRFTVTLVNDGTIAHSIDFHASVLAPDVPMRSIEPGESLVYEFTAVGAGVWMYHCGTHPMVQHIGNGMYGAVVIDPPELPEVDREYAVVQSELYLGDEGGHGDFAAMAAGEPDAVVFNGYHGQYRHAPLEAAAGDRVRVWVLNAGIERSSAFHVVGTQFDTVFSEGAYLLRPGNAEHGAAQVLAAVPAQGGFVEFVLPEAGHYPFVTHAMVDAERGAVGVFAVE